MMLRSCVFSDLYEGIEKQGLEGGYVCGALLNGAETDAKAFPLSARRKIMALSILQAEWTTAVAVGSPNLMRLRMVYTP
jgi:hypothetical protein